MEPTQFQYTYTSTLSGRGGFTIYVANNVGYPVIQLYYNVETEEEALEQARIRMTTTGYYDSRNNLNYEPEGSPAPNLTGTRNIEITGRIASSENNLPLEGATIRYQNSSIQADNRGFFRLQFEFTPGDTINQLRITQNGFGDSLVAIANQDNTFKADVGVVLMEPIDQNTIDLEAEVVANGIEDQIETLRDLNPADAKAALISRITRAQGELYQRLIPAVITLLARFNLKVTNNALVSSQSQSCPPFSQIQDTINKRNRLTRQLNKLYNTVRSITGAVTAIRNIIEVISVLFRILKFLPLPTGAPPFIGIPMSLVQKIDDEKDKIEQRIGAGERIATVVLAVLALLGGAIQNVLQLLSGLDNAIGSCIDEARETVVQTLALENEFVTGSIATGSANVGIGIGSNGQDFRSGLDENSGDSGMDFRNVPNLNDILGTTGLDNNDIADLLAGNYFQEQLNSDLVNFSALLAEQEGRSRDGDLGREVNGFILDVQTDPRYEVGKINRRFAVGKNRDGIVLIQGDPSFASSDEILIDELAFFIEQNDLKPN